MARLNGGLMSKLKGKLAGVVFQQYEGLNVAKEYQPNVKNPSSQAQVVNRAKFKGASQMVALFGSIFGIALASISPYIRTLRGMAVKALRSAFLWNDESKKASITPTAAAAAINAIANNGLVPAPVIAGATIANLTLSAEPDDNVFYRIVAYDGSGATIGVGEESFVASSEPEHVLAPRTSGTPSGYTIAAVATRAVDGVGNPNYSNLQDASSIEVIRAANAGVVLASPVTMGSVTA